MNKLNENIFHQYNKWKQGYERKENSLQTRLNNFLSNEKDRHADKYHISEDGKYVDCNTDVYLYDSDLIDGKFPFSFGKINGHFNCANCENLKSLEGAPQKIKKDFFCSQCENLTSLVGAPKEVGRSFIIYGCSKITSLEGVPEEVGGGMFNCIKCPNLTSLEGLPKMIGNMLYVDKRFKGNIPEYVNAKYVDYYE